MSISKERLELEKPKEPQILHKSSSEMQLSKIAAVPAPHRDLPEIQPLTRQRAHSFSPLESKPEEASQSDQIMASSLRNIRQQEQIIQPENGDEVNVAEPVQRQKRAYVLTEAQQKLHDERQLAKQNAAKSPEYLELFTASISALFSEKEEPPELEAVEKQQEKTSKSKDKETELHKQKLAEGKKVSKNFATEYTADISGQLKQSTDARKNVYAKLDEEGITDYNNIAAFMSKSPEEALALAKDYQNDDETHSTRRPVLEKAMQEILDMKFTPTEMTGTEMSKDANKLVDMHYKLQAFPALLKENPWFEAELPLEQKEKLDSALAMQEYFSRSLLSFLYMNGVSTTGEGVTEKRLVQIATMMNEENLVSYMEHSQDRVNMLANLPGRTRALQAFLARASIDAERLAEAEAATAIGRTELSALWKKAHDASVNTAFAEYVKASGKSLSQLAEEKGIGITDDVFKADWIKAFVDERKKEEDAADKKLAELKAGKRADSASPISPAVQQVHTTVSQTMAAIISEANIKTQHEGAFTSAEMNQLRDSAKKFSETPEFLKEDYVKKYMVEDTGQLNSSIISENIVKNIDRLSERLAELQSQAETNLQLCTSEAAMSPQERQVAAESYVRSYAESIIMDNAITLLKKQLTQPPIPSEIQENGEFDNSDVQPDGQRKSAKA